MILVEQLGYGALVGLGIGLGGGWLLEMARRHKWMAHASSQTTLVALPAPCLLVSEGVGASMFIAAFVAGLAVQVGFREVAKESVGFTEEWGQPLNFSVFFLFGMLSTRYAAQLDVAALAYAVLSLTVVRMLPVRRVSRHFAKIRANPAGFFAPRRLTPLP